MVLPRRDESTTPVTSPGWFRLCDSPTVGASTSVVFRSAKGRSFAERKTSLSGCAFSASETGDCVSRRAAADYSLGRTLRPPQDTRPPEITSAPKGRPRFDPDPRVSERTNLTDEGVAPAGLHTRRSALEPGAGDAARPRLYSAAAPRLNMGYHGSDSNSRKDTETNQRTDRQRCTVWHRSLRSSVRHTHHAFPYNQRSKSSRCARNFGPIERGSRRGAKLAEIADSASFAPLCET